MLNPKGPMVRFVPWPLQTIAQIPDGLRPIEKWGSACARGFVSDERFARPGDQVIKRTNRDVTKKWHKLDEPLK